ncbi:MAG: hypothetical protein ABI461_11185, partial [Polyangiaceae bacterium]
MRRLALWSITSLGPLALAMSTFTATAMAAPKKKPPAPEAPADKSPEKPADPSPAGPSLGGDATATAAPASTPSASDSSAKSKDDSNGKSEDDEPVDDTLDAVEGISECNAYEEKNAHDLAIWEKTQPPTPYKYPERRTFLDAPWMPLFDGISYSGALLAATLVPNVHAVLRGVNPEAGFSFPWAIPLGPALWCTRKKGSFDVIKYRPIRILVEPGFFAEQPIVFWVRPAARFMWHPTSWFFGVGGGIGSLLEMTGKEPFRASVSPEISVALGRCCNPGYFSLSLRHDFFVEGKTQLTSASVGFTYF